MRAFPPGFLAETQRDDGAAPTWLLKLTVGGADYFLGEDSFNIQNWSGAAVPVLGWVRSWGKISEALSGDLNEIQVAGLSLDVLVDPDADPNIEDLATGFDLEEAPVSLFAWFHGLDAATDPPQEIMRGYVRDVSLPDDLVARLDIEDETVRLERYVGRRVSRFEFPEADPDDVGKMIPIVFGSVERLPALAVEAGIRTSLPATITAGATSFSVSDATGADVGEVLQIDEEELRVDAVAGDVLTVTRGYNATAATTHAKGAVVWQKRSRFVYLVADHPVDSIDKILGRVGEAELDISPICSIYTGKPGSELAGYEGRAVVTIPGYITAAQAVDLLAVDTIEVNDTISVSDTITVNDGISVSNGSHGHASAVQVSTFNLEDVTIAVGSATFPSRAIDSDFTAACLLGNTSTLWCYRRSLASPGGQPSRLRFGIVSGDAGYSGSVTARLYVNGSLQTTVAAGGSVKTTKRSAYVNLGAYADLSAGNTYIELVGGSLNSYIYNVWFEVEFDPSPPAVGEIVTKNGAATKGGAATKQGAATKGGTVVLSGNSTANTLVGDRILVSLTRNLSAPGDVIAEILSSYCGGLGFQQIGALPASYRFDGALTKYRRAIDWLTDLAFQARSYFRMRLGEGRLIVRPTAPASLLTIAACAATESGRILSREKAPLESVINRIALFYLRDWSLDGSDEKSYRGISEGSDAASIGKYGERERPSLWRFDFVASPAMADDLVASYLSLLAGRKWLYSFEVYLEHLALEFADQVALGFLADQVVEITEAGISPGSSDKADVVELVARG